MNSEVSACAVGEDYKTLLIYQHHPPGSTIDIGITEVRAYSLVSDDLDKSNLSSNEHLLIH